MSLSFSDVEKLEALYPEHQIELREGNLIIRNPSDGVTGEIGAQVSTQLNSWVLQNNLGRVFTARTGVLLPNGDLLSPNISFVSRQELRHNTRTYLFVVPELIVEIKSSRDRVRHLEEKISLFLSQGVQVGLLIDPDKHIVSIYRPDKSGTQDESDKFPTQKVMLHDGDNLSIPDLFPGWEIPITSLWPLEYE